MLYLRAVEFAIMSLYKFMYRKTTVRIVAKQVEICREQR